MLGKHLKQMHLLILIKFNYTAIQIEKWYTIILDDFHSFKGKKNTCKS